MNDSRETIKIPENTQLPLRIFLVEIDVNHVSITASGVARPGPTLAQALSQLQIWALPKTYLAYFTEKYTINFE